MDGRSARRALLRAATRLAPARLLAAYPTPKVDVRGVVFRDDEVLLVREVSDRRWSLPGGWAEVGESPAEAAVREVFEQSGYRTRATKLLALLNSQRAHDGKPIRPNIYKIFIRCDLVSDDQGALTGSETSDARFFAEDALPELSEPRVSPEQLVRVFLHRRDPKRSPDFD